MKYRSAIASGLILSLALFCLPHSASAAPPLHLVANYWEPYTGDSLPSRGLASAIVITALKRAGYDATIDIMPWARVLATAYSGKADGVVAIWPTAERRSKLLFSDSYMANELVLLHMTGHLASRKSLSDLDGLTVGIGYGYDYSDEFLALKNFKSEPVTTVMQNLRKLVIGRVDMVLEDRRIAEFNIRTHAGEDERLRRIDLSGPVVMQLPLHFALSPATPDAQKILAAFNAELRRMGRDGTLAALLAKPQP